MTHKKIKLTATVALASILLAVPNVVMAWSTSESAQATCLSNTANIGVSFKNTETDKTLAMNVIAKDNQTNNSVNLGTIQAQQTKTGTITTGVNKLNNGTVTFALTWTNKSGSDSRTVNYNAVTCQAPTSTPTPKPTVTPKPTCTPTPRPSATPTPKLTETPTPKPTETPEPTKTPSATPTTIPTSSVTPTEVPQPTQIVINNTNNNNNVNSIDITNNNTATATAIASTPSNTTVQSAAQTTTLPSTGTAIEAYGVFSLLPLGAYIRKFTKLNK